MSPRCYRPSMTEEGDDQLPAPSHDALLAVLNGLVNMGEGNLMGIQLTTGGNVVDGVLVSADRWFEVVTAMVDDSNAPDIANALRVAVGHRFPEGDLDEGMAQGIAEVSRYLRDSEFLHLLSATHVGADGRSMTVAKPWRGRLSFVAGWSFSSTSLDG